MNAPTGTFFFAKSVGVVRYGGDVLCIWLSVLFQQFPSPLKLIVQSGMCEHC